MPELPEVETVVMGLRSQNIIGVPIFSCEILFDKLIENPRQFEKDVQHTCIFSIRRRGKYIIFDLDSGYSLIIHLRMTGKLRVYDNLPPQDPYRRALFVFADKRVLVFSDVRKFGRFVCTKAADEYLSFLGLEIVGSAVCREKLLEEFKLRIGHTKRVIKLVLLDQRVVSGIGNIYADEALFQAHIHPKTKACALREKELVELFQAISDVLEKAIERQGSSLGKGLGNFVSAYGKEGKNQSYFAVYQRTGKPCVSCKTAIQRIVLGQRSTHFCPSCQKKRDET